MIKKVIHILLAIVIVLSCGILCTACAGGDTDADGKDDDRVIPNEDKYSDLLSDGYTLSNVIEWIE